MNNAPLIASLLAKPPLGTTVTVNGWTKTRRDANHFSFIEINDGSCLANLQVIADRKLANYATEIKKLTTGCALTVTGSLVASPAKGQAVELQADAITVHGWADPDSYPLQKKRHSFAFLRSIPHLRPRTNTLAAVARIRSKLTMMIHHFLQERHFILLHTPIITTSDCEGAGEMFTVTSLEMEQGEQTAPFHFGKDFFGCRAGLTVSGQLEAESYALAMGRVYTFGPTFRAENSNTSRHLAEFWMVEPELAFCDLTGDMDLAEDFLRTVVADLMQKATADLELFAKFIDKGLPDRLQAMTEQPFERLTYTDAINTLRQSGRQFDYPVSWGIDLQAEHERFLTEEICQKPVIVTDYPKGIKPFYMRLNDDGKTVAAMDILLPGIGEIIGGSQREERLDVLEERMTKQGLDLEKYRWYTDLRRYGSAPHAGFGLGFERLVQVVTGMANIRDVIPFPRTPGHAS